jgi:hypothetical protein
MKRKMCLLYLGLALSIINFAQQSQLGIKAGLNAGYIDGRSSDDAYGLINVHTGIFASHDFNKIVGVQAEALMNTLSTTVYKEIFIPQSYLNPQKANLLYLSFPLLLRIKATEKLIFHAGMQYSVLLGNERRLTNTNTDAFTNGNLSLVFGFQANTGKRLHLYLRCNPGLTATGHDPNGSYYNNRGKTSFVTQLGLGYTIFNGSHRKL